MPQWPRCAVLPFMIFCAMGRPGVTLALTQPNGAVVPTQLGCSAGQPTGLAAVFACQCDAVTCNIGLPCFAIPCDNGQHSTCETTLWHAFNDNACVPSLISGLNPYTDGALTPVAFYPTGPMTVRVASRTGTFRPTLYWYNTAGQKPTALDLHEAAPCGAEAGSEYVLDLWTDSNYLGGPIGFALVSPESHTTPGTCDGGDCCGRASRLPGAGYLYCTERQYDADYVGDPSVIHMILYRSRIEAHRYYLAAEDVLGGGPGSFTGFVARISGISDTNLLGVGTDPGPALRLHDPRPNPFHPPATIRFDLPRTAQVRLAVFDLAGRQVRELVDARLDAGAHETNWDGRDSEGRGTGPGVYFVRLAVEGVVARNRMLLLR